LSPISFHSASKEDYTYLAEDKYSAITLFSVAETNVALKIPYLRESFQKNGQKVSSVIGETLPNTFVLAISAIVVALIIGIFFGIISALHKDSALDKTIQVLSTLGMSVPSFFSAILFAWFFGYVLHEYTHLNMTGSLYELDDFGEENRLQLKNLILPALVLGIRPLAVVIQLMRNSLLEILQQDYIRTARAKGLSEYIVFMKHAFKNIMNSLITVVGLAFALLLGGAIIVETVFSYPGIGRLVVQAVTRRDYPLIQGELLLVASSCVIVNLIVDILYPFFDPRIKYK